MEEGVVFLKRERDSKFFDSIIVKASGFVASLIGIFGWLPIWSKPIIIASVLLVVILLRFAKQLKEPWYTISIIILTLALAYTWYSDEKYSRSTNVKTQLARSDKKKCFIESIDQLTTDFPDNTDYKNFPKYLDKNTNVNTLRDKCFQREKPFQHEFLEVRISFPDKQPKKGTFVTCDNSPFLHKKIQISNLDFSKQIERKSLGPSGTKCTTESIMIQLNKKDGKKLFGKHLFKDGKNSRVGFATVVQSE